MTFSIHTLVGERVLVKGTDQFGVTGQTVLDSSQWAQVNSHKEYDQATEAFEQAVEEFFAPILDAAAQLDQAKAKPEPDSIGYVVLSEPEEGRPAKPGHLVKLTHDSIVLRLLEGGQHDRLAWVGDNLEVLGEQVPTTPGTSPAEVAEAQAEVSEQTDRVFDDQV